MSKWVSEWVNSQWGLDSYVSLSLCIPPPHSPSNGFQGMALFIFPLRAGMSHAERTPAHSARSTRIFVSPQSAQCVLFSLFLKKLLKTVKNRHRWAKETFLSWALCIWESWGIRHTLECAYRMLWPWSFLRGWGNSSTVSKLVSSQYDQMIILTCDRGFFTGSKS